MIENYEIPLPFHNYDEEHPLSSLMSKARKGNNRNDVFLIRRIRTASTKAIRPVICGRTFGHLSAVDGEIALPAPLPVGFADTLELVGDSEATLEIDLSPSGQEVQKAHDV